MTRRARAACLVVACVAWGLACSPDPASPQDTDFDLRIEPSPPAAGDARLSLRLSGPEGPLEGARVRVEGNMSHAGMKPSFASLEELEPGRYEGTLRFSMGGDWLLIVTATTADGRALERVIEVPGVASM